MSLHIVDEQIRTLAKTSASGAMTAQEMSQTDFVIYRVRNTTASGGTLSALKVYFQGSMDKTYWTYMPSGATVPWMFKMTKFNKTSTGVVRQVYLLQPLPKYLRLYAVVSGGSGPAWTIEAKAQRYERVD